MNIEVCDAALATPSDRAWTGIVLRPAHAAWDGTRYRGSSPAEPDRDALAALEPAQLVQQGDFLAIAAPTAELARAAVERLAVRWSAPPHDPMPTHTTAPHAGSAHDYVWPCNAAGAGDTVQAWAVWTSGGDLAVQAQAVEPRRLRRELAQLFGIDPDRVRVGVVGRGESPAPVFAPEGHDAALDAALIARAIGHTVHVEGVLAPTPLALGIRLQAQAAGAPHGSALWRMSPEWPLARRPPWSAFAAGWTQRAEGSAAHGSAMPYRLALETLPPTHPLTPQWRIDPRAAEAATTFAIESFTDECAREGGWDPVQWRLNHLSDGQGRALVQAVAQRAAWQHGAAPPGRVGDGPRTGRGFACATTVDDSTEQPQRAWAAWVVDLKVDALAGRIDIAGLTVGHHVEGMHAAPLHDEAMQARISAAAAQLLSGPQSHADWSGGTTSSPTPAVRVVELAPTADSRALTNLSTSRALMLPLAAAIANAIHDATGIRLRTPPFDGPALQRAAREAMPAARADTAGLDHTPVPTGSEEERRAPWRKATAWVGAAAATVAGLAVAAMPWRSAIAPVVPDLGVYASSAIERGRLIASASDCVVCHTAPGGTPNAGGLAMDTPFGTIFSTNITPDPKTGIGAWSYQAFERAMRHGIGRDGRHLYPAFPYTAFAKIDDGDMQALYAFLMTQPAVASEPPQTQLAFPYSVRPMMAAWNALFHDATPYAPDASRSVLWNRGAYLVNGVGHCGACHTPRNAFGAEKNGPHFLAGATVKAWDAPALNRLSREAQPWSREDIYTYLRTGHSDRHGVAAGPMAPVIEGLSALPDRDILAMATYLSSLSASADAATPADAAWAAVPHTPPVAVARSAQTQSLPGHRIFEGACAACHDPARGMPLFGVRPNLAFNTNVTADRPDNLVQVILHGINNPASEDLGFMPGFAGSLNDQQVGDLVRYLRAEHAGDQPRWDRVEDTVARIRRSGSAHAPPSGVAP